jgi:tRNA threonylcarbamoyl adenosine modification protein YeaZ
MQIAIDTSTDYAGLALADNDRLISAQSWRCGSNHTVELYPRLDALLKAAGCDCASIDCIYVAVGPGSFNGLRVGVSAAKTISYTLGIPIIGIGTLEYTAYQHAASGIQVCAVQNAGRREVACALFRLRPRKGWSTLQEAHIAEPLDLVASIKEPTIFCGEIDDRIEQILKKGLRSKAVFPSALLRMRQPASLVALGFMRRNNSIFDDASALQPVYLRKPPITRRKKA